MSAAFSQGPWSVHYEPTRGEKTRLEIVPGLAGPRTCAGVEIFADATVGAAHRSWACTKANAQLMATAPDLYAALTTCVAALAATGTPTPALEQATAALARADEVLP